MAAGSERFLNGPGISCGPTRAQPISAPDGGSTSRTP
jgi:hypothetical protein